jgi:MoaA/NifB/PqqE/SkfB family radical SAM enzyme
MSWETARSALTTVLSEAGAEVAVEFAGGEPLLEVDTLRRAVGFVESSRPPGTVVEYTLTTNGTLLTTSLFEFLSRHEFTIRISFDGVPAAQDHRGKGTQRILDGLLGRLHDHDPAGFARRVRVVVTVLPSTIPFLGASVGYLMGRGVEAIEVGPRFTWDRDWTPSCRDELERQIEAVLRLSHEHWRETGRVPVDFLAGPPPLERRREMGFLCGAPLARSLGVDPGGRAWACPVFITSLAKLPPLALEASRALDLGPIASLSFPRRLGRLPEKVAGLRLFTDRLGKRSSFGACARCRFAESCRVCPASISHNPHNLDPDLIPDFVCSFSYLTLAARERFDEMTGGTRTAAWSNEMAGALDQLEAAVRESVATLESRRPNGTPRGRATPK